MKSAKLTSILIGITACSAVASLVLCGIVMRRAGEIGGLQQRAAAIQQSRMAATALVNELGEYSKKDPQIVPILKSIATQPAPAQPSAK